MLLSEYINPILSFLTPSASPVLAEIIVVNRVPMHFIFNPPELTALDSALEAHPGAPHIRWRPNFYGSERDKGIVEFISLAQAGMPRAHKNGRLFIEPQPDHGH